MTMLTNTLTICSVMCNEYNRISSFMSAATRYTKNIVVVLQESNDGSDELLRSHGILPIHDSRHGHPEPSYSLLLDHISTPWALLLDADEVLEADGDLVHNTLTGSVDIGSYALYRETRLLEVQELGIEELCLEQDYHLRLFKPGHVVLPSAIHTRITCNERSQSAKLEPMTGMILHIKSFHEQLTDDCNYMNVMNGTWTSPTQKALLDGLVNTASKALRKPMDNLSSKYYRTEGLGFIEGLETARVNPDYFQKNPFHSPTLGPIYIDSPFSRLASSVTFPICKFPNYTHEPIQQLFDRYAIKDHWNLFVEPNTIAIDIGAHVGDTSIVMSALVGPRGYILAFEPNPLVWQSLELVAALNHPSHNILPVYAAVSDQHLHSSVYADHGNSNINGGLDLASRFEVSAWSKSLFADIPGQIRYNAFTVKLQPVVNEFVHRNLVPEGMRVSFLKIDSEGFESFIIDGNNEFIAYHKPVLYLEWFQHHSTEDTSKLFDSIQALSYIPLSPESLQPLSRDSAWIPDILCLHSSHAHSLEFFSKINHENLISEVRNKIAGLIGRDTPDKV